MSQYVDASALVKRYVAERDSADAIARLDADTEWVSARHTSVEVVRGLTTSLTGRPLAEARAAFVADWERTMVVELDEEVCERAADFVATLGVRTLDALHLAAAHRVGFGALPILTYDLRQAQAARNLGWTVLGA